MLRSLAPCCKHMAREEAGEGVDFVGEGANVLTHFHHILLDDIIGIVLVVVPAHGRPRLARHRHQEIVTGSVGGRVTNTFACPETLALFLGEALLVPQHQIRKLQPPPVATTT